MYLEFVFFCLCYIYVSTNKHKQISKYLKHTKAQTQINTICGFQVATSKNPTKKRKKVLEHIKSEMLERRKTIFTSWNLCVNRLCRIPFENMLSDNHKMH